MLSAKKAQFWISFFSLAGILASCHDDRDVLLLKSCLLTVQSDHGAQTAAGTGEDAPIPAAQCLQRTAWSKTTNGPLAIAGGSEGAAMVRLQIEWRGGGSGTGR